MQPQTIPSLSELRWRCRRGMLELDIILGGFVDRHYVDLSPPDQALFVELIAQDDPTLLGWLLGHEPPARRFSQLIQRITQ